MEKIKCKSCGELIEQDCAFCPKCGEALTSVAQQIKKEERRGAMLEVIIALTDKIKNPEDLKILNELLQKIKPE